MYRLAEQISKHESFERGTNVDFADTEKGKIRIKTFERGVGWTKACGTGGGAVFAVCRRLGLVGEKSTVFFDGGSLTVETEENKIFITGEVKRSGKDERKKELPYGSIVALVTPFDKYGRVDCKKSNSWWGGTRQAER